MAYDKLILLAPCHGLEDFPLYHTGDDAASLLASWTALWHPLLIAGAKALPCVERCDYPPEDIDNALLVVPKPCEAELDPDLLAEAKNKNATLIHAQTSRADIIKQAIDNFPGELPDNAASIEKELTRDFLALGFAYFQVEVLTQQMRYASSIDQSRIQRDVQAAAKALLENDHATCRDKLTACHDALSDERNHYYPVDVYLLDLTLLATSDATLGRALDRQLDLQVPQNFQASGQAIEQLANVNPSALSVLQSRHAEGTVSLAGGEYEELDLPLMSLDSAAEQLSQGEAAYKQHLGARPDCYARRKHGIYPSLQSAIRHAGYDCGLHFKFDEGKIPGSSQGKTKWKLGDDELECYARSPIDASSHDSFLNLPTLMSETMDSDHVAVRMFVHWPGCATPWYEDLLRCARYGTALGRFATLREFFSEASDYSTTDTFAPNDYVYPTLQQSVSAKQSDPISNWPNYWRNAIETTMRTGERAMRHFHAVPPAVSDSNETIQTVLNTASFPRRIRLSTNHTQSAQGDTVYASAKQQDGKMATLVDVPGMGFATVRFNGQETTGPDLAENLTLGNEFFQATIDADTGSLRSIKDYRSRNTRLSQQLAFRITLPKTGQPWVDRQAPVGYTVMAADAVDITQNGKLHAEITTKGRLLALNGEQLGEFTQRYQITRGSRVLVVEANVSVDESLYLDDAWDSYCAFRFAYGDESAILRAGCRMQIHDVSKSRFEAPLLVDIDSANTRTTILTGGLPFHRRVNLSQLDSLVSVVGEQSTRYRIGIGVDLPNPMREAIDFLGSTQAPTVVQPKMGAETGWLFHLDAKNLIVSSWQCEQENSIRLRIVETDGRKSKSRIRFFRPLLSGRVVDANGHTISELKLEDGTAIVAAGRYSYQEIELCW